MMKRDLCFTLGMLAVLWVTECKATERRHLEEWSAERVWKDCIPLMDLDLSDDQRFEMREKERLFRRLIMETRVELTAKRLEFIKALRDPNSPEDIIRARSKEMDEAIMRLQDLMLNNVLEIRHILNSKQRSIWCPPFIKSFQRIQDRRHRYFKEDSKR